jgi:hypothetical protein
MEKKITTPAIKGIIISLILIVFSLAIQFLDLSRNKGIGALQFILLIGGIVWSCISYAKQLNGNVTFGNTFAHGFKTTAAVTAITVVYTIVSLKFIMPEAIDIGLEEARKGMEEGNMSDDQIEQALSMTKKFFVPITAGTLILFFIVCGAIASLIGAAVAKKKPQGPFVQQG